MPNSKEFSSLDGIVLPEQLAPRHSLLNHFHRASARRLGFVSAPAGSGKTVTSLLWLRDSGREGVWMPLGERHNSLAYFYESLGRRLLSFQPYNREISKILERSNFGSAPMENFERMVAALAKEDTLYAFIIDDFHLIKNEEIIKSLPSALLSLPYTYCSFVLSRTPPSGGFATLLEKAVEIKGPDLAFSAKEISDYFESNGRILTDEESAAAHSATNGWAMGVNVLLLCGDTSPSQGEVLVIEKYLHEHFWNTLPEDSRSFLIKTAMIEEMTPEICEILTGRKDSGEMLLAFSTANMFIVNSGPGTYRCHHLFQNFLEKILEKTPDLDVVELYTKAAQYYLDQNALYEALRFSAKARDNKRIEACMLRLYQYSTQGNSVAEHADRLKTYLMDLVPGEMLEENPYLLINYIWYHYLRNDPELMLHYLDKIYENFDLLVARHPEFLELGLLITTLDFRKPATGIVLELENPLLPTGSREAMQTVTMTENMPFYHRSNQDYSTYALDLCGSLQAFAMAFGSILGPDILRISTAGLRGGILYEQDRLAEARAAADMAVASLKRETVAELKMGAMLLQAVISRAEDAEDVYEQKLSEIKIFLERESADYLMPNLVAVETKYRLADAGKNIAREWLQRYFVTESEKPEFYKLYQHFTTARAYIVLGRTDDALALLCKLRLLGASYRRPLDAAEAGILESVVLWAMGKKQRGLEALVKALTSIQAFRFTRMAVDEGAALAPLLKLLLKQIDSGEYQGVLERAYVNDIYFGACAMAKRHRGLAANIRAKAVKLSKQQKRILELMAKGFKQSAIAEKTALALPTIKSHTYVMYKKLDVNNATDAIIKARELGLIE